MDGKVAQGAAYVFTRSDVTWSRQAKLTANDGAAHDLFGFSVALAGDAALVGAASATVGANVGQGAAYVFIQRGETWSRQAKLTANDGAAEDDFGVSVAFAGDRALVGAQEADAGANVDQGAAYVFLPPLTPAALAVDPTPLDSDGNGVFEPDEAVEMASFWRNNDDEQAFADGILSSFQGPGGASYDIVTNGVGYAIPPGESGSCQDSEGGCYELETQLTQAERPAVHWDATVEEELQIGTGEFVTHTWTLHLGDSFTDVPRASVFYPSIETLLHHGISSEPALARRALAVMGCAEGEFCPTAPTTRAQAAVLLLQGHDGSDSTPADCVAGEERFDDVPATSPFCPWVDELADRGVTTGCGGDRFCPEGTVTRAQMAVLLLKTLMGPEYTPPDCAGTFTDVACPSLFADWIEDLHARGVTAGCTTEPLAYCPAATVTRAQMAAFVTRTFELVLYGP